ncbi:single-stranded-DNA-specific exonuclease RecJ [Gracilibacillus sp. YIM 98692]|uniref:single-stranded-DNA-specific exonuclease RecJ n=1 Tax=Gracilibacillus sp. YIM 98692 TaxID=2663532 RepID=UPI0013D7DC14|nr:single-stranded-DNA-specific exonuclease RecJ [Gracilibacillus sp. YIM 98692]
MLSSQSNWTFTYNEEKIEELAMLKGVDLPDTLKKLLWQRGIRTEEEAEQFLYPSLDQLCDPASFSSIDRAISRVKQAIEQGESILVYGDYDADGVTSTAVMVEALRESGAMCDYYIPNRFTEGYGPNQEAFEEAYRQGFQLIITVDNGIAGIDEVELAQKRGMDVIITDHHEVQEQLPEAYAIIHPKCSDAYPFKELAGVGVAFKFATHLLGYFPKQFLDLVAIGTVADLVPLVDENRILVKHGLKTLTQTSRAGVKALKKLCSIEGTVSEEDIGFRIAPRLNAVGRLQDANLAVDLLLTQDPEEAEELSNYVQDLNTERQKIVGEITQEAIHILEENQNLEDQHVLVVAREGWNQGVLGIVASKLVQTYSRPAIVLTINPETLQAKGSARSIDAFDLFQNCMKVKELFTHFGGHAQAAGMTLPVDHIKELQQQLEDLAKSQLTSEDFKPQLNIDLRLNIQDMALELVKNLESFAPFGMGNPKPLFHLEGIPTEIRQIGATKSHLKLKFTSKGVQLDSIGFGLGDQYEQLAQQTTMEVVGELQVNEWNGIQKPQLLMKDMAVNDWQLFDFRGTSKWKKQLDQQVRRSYYLKFQQDTVVPGINQILQPSELIDMNESIDSLYILDLPQQLNELTRVLEKIQVKRIYACFQLQQSNYFQSMPTREEFKWLYQLILKRGYFNYKKDAPKLSEFKGWKLEKIKFMFQVFHDLNFVTKESANIIPKNNPEKKDLTESALYQEMSDRMQVEEILYYSSYHQLKKWISEQMEKTQVPEEEMAYGL